MEKRSVKKVRGAEICHRALVLSLFIGFASMSGFAGVPVSLSAPAMSGDAGKHWGGSRSSRTGSSPAADGVFSAGMVRIPGGTNRGTDPDAGSYLLTVRTFWMDATEVTKAQWDAVYVWAIANDYSFDNAGSGKAGNHPVQTVNWYDCVKWCNARSEKNGKTPCYTIGGRTYKAGCSEPDYNFSASGYRLPTSDEWEYAARGGVSGTRFPWGNTITHCYANEWSSADDIYDTSLSRGYHPSYDRGDFPYTSPAGSFAANGFGLYDMSGNVREWCDTLSRSNRVLRGGCWNLRAHNARCCAKSTCDPVLATITDGFRSVSRGNP